MHRLTQPAALTALAAVLATPVQAQTLGQGARIAVTVVDGAGRAQANASVCLRTADNSEALATTQTNAQGQASVPLPGTMQAGAMPNGGYALTASNGSRGVARSVTGLGAITLVLPPSGGPQCNVADRPNSGFTAQVDAARLRERVAEVAAKPIGQRVGELRLLQQHCFGAAGMQCSDIPQGQLSTCLQTDNVCSINRGSWRHDECCIPNPTGGMCDLLGAGGFQPGGVCQSEFNEAVARLATAYTWKRRVDFNVANTTGRVDHAAYCAPGGTILPLGEGEFCCTRTQRVPTPAERVTFGVRRVPPADADRVGICTGSSQL